MSVGRCQRRRCAGLAIAPAVFSVRRESAGKLHSLVIVLIVITRVAALLTAGIRVPLVTRSLPAVIAAFTAAVAPNCVSENLQNFDRGNRIVAGDDEFTGPRALFRSFV